MPAGRKPMGIEQVELLSGSAAAKLRLEVFLASVAGELSVQQACQALGLEKSRFFELRRRWLQGSVEALEPEPSGRPVGAVREMSGTSPNLAIDPEIGSDCEKRPPRITYNASAGPGPTPDTSGNGPVGPPHQRIAQLQEQVGQLQCELRVARLREELAALGLSRPNVAERAPKKKGTARWGAGGAR